MTRKPTWKEQEMHVHIDYSNKKERRVRVQTTHPVAVRRLRKDERFLPTSEEDRYFVQGEWLGRSIPVSLVPASPRSVQKQAQKPSGESNTDKPGQNGGE